MGKEIEPSAVPFPRAALGYCSDTDKFYVLAVDEKGRLVLAPAGAPTNAKYVLLEWHDELPYAELHQYLTGDQLHDNKPHTHVEADITDLLHNAIKLQGRALASTAPTEGQAVVWDQAGNTWKPASVAGVQKFTALLTPEAAVYPATAFAALYKVNGTNFSWYEALFDASTDEYLYFKVPIPAIYSQGNLKVTIFWKAAAITGNVVWSVSHYDRADGEAFDAAATETQSVTDAAKGTTEYVNKCYVTFTTKPDDNDIMILKVMRDADNASDTMSGDAKLLAVLVEEQ